MWMHRRDLVTRHRAPAREVRRFSENRPRMHEPLSPELALIDPELAARARAALPEPGSFGARRFPPGQATGRDRRARPGRCREHAPVSAVGAGHRGALAAGPGHPHRRSGDPACAGHAPCPPPGRRARPRSASLRRSRPARSSRAWDRRFARAPDDRLTRRSRRGGPLQSASRGAIAQLGERLDRTQEVAGSSPASSIRNTPEPGHRCTTDRPARQRSGGRAAGGMSRRGHSESQIADRRLGDRSLRLFAWGEACRCARQRSVDG